MRRFLVVLGVLVLATAAYAQTGPEAALNLVPEAVAARVTEPDFPLTHSDLYCAGFIANPMKVTQFVAGGLNTPYQTRFTGGDLIFLKGGDYQVGTRVSIIRQLHDVNRTYPIAGSRQMERRVGQVYADIGYAVVLERRGGIAIAQVEFACDEIVNGDQLMPFQPRDLPTYRKHSSLDQFPAEKPAVRGRIVGARDFDQYMGADRKVYLDVGARQGLKAGDYLRIVRGYGQQALDIADQAMQYAPPWDDTQRMAPQLTPRQVAALPRRVVGEVIVLSTQPGTATAMITFALEDVHVGDAVELEPKTEER